MKKIIITVLIAVALMGAGGMIFYQANLGAMSQVEAKVAFSVENGTSLNRTIGQLHEQGLIANETAAKIYCRLNGITSVQANTYELDMSMDLKKIMRIISTGDHDYVIMAKVTVLDGQRISDIVATLNGLGLDGERFGEYINDENNLKGWIDTYWWLTSDVLQPEIKYPLEGYLAPETYFVQAGDDALAQLAAAMLEQTDAVLSPLQDAISTFQVDGKTLTVHEFMTLSSIVQAESLNSDDALVIAGVFVNRLEANMPLQSDVTVNYANDEIKVAVTHADLATDSKYNTYLYAGLPIGPIATIDREIYNSVLNYTPNDYFYFFALEDGSIIYSKTYQEHLKVVQENKWY
ncbi:MAG: endolytic transglycosylase MltG [Erysipelotrichaceae bacterium]|nr:endolytic transglycosylase MltG [Erysipelotrichaceae bacterium]